MSALLPIFGGIGSGLLSAIGSIGYILVELAKTVIEYTLRLINWFMENPEKGLMGVGMIWALLSPI